MGRPADSRATAFTLLEVMLGIGLAGTLLLMVLLLASSALTSDSKASDRQIASAVAEAQLDLLARRVALAGSPARQAFWQAPDGEYSGAGVEPSVLSNGTAYTLSYRLEWLRDAGGQPLGQAGNRMRQVLLRVEWWEGEAGRRGHGQFTVDRIRVLRESDVRT
jgi:type II secretory pathway pseudopilin PulG